MKKKNLICFPIIALLFMGCAKSDAPKDLSTIFPKNIVKTGTFTDARDNHTYTTVKIGKQEWMAENLAYALPGYSFDGAYTWGEPTIDFKKAIKSYSPEVSDETLLLYIQTVLNDPQYNGFEFMPGMKLTMVAKGLIRRYEKGQMTLEEVKNILEQYSPDFQKALHEHMLAQIDIQEAKSAMGKKSFEEAEKENGGYVKKYGFLYSFEGAQQAIPEGWRLPSDADWQQLECTLGLSPEEAAQKNKWRGLGLATLLNKDGASQFNALPAGCNTYQVSPSDLYYAKGERWYFWTSSTEALNDSTTLAITRQSSNFNTKVWRGTSPITNFKRPILFSVRCVRDL